MQGGLNKIFDNACALTVPLFTVSHLTEAIPMATLTETCFIATLSREHAEAATTLKH